MSFNLRLFRTVWGILKETDGILARSPYRDLENALPAIKKLGYDGVEVPLKLALYFGKERFKSMLEQNNLKAIMMVFTDGPVAPGAGGLWGGPYPGHPAPGESVKEHLAVFKAQVETAQFFDPVLVNSHSLKDYHTFAEAGEFFENVLPWQDSKGFTVYHETHRKRFLHSPWVARDFLPKFPKMKLVADLSHWINVAETDTNDKVLNKAIETIAPMVYHTHGRVGYDHGPQVVDPRAPEWRPYTEGHERWWTAIWKAQKARGDQKFTTFTPEHGPPNYQPTAPYSRMPLADIWDVNHWIGLRQQEKFGEIYGKQNTSKLVPSESQGLDPK
jgi:sugar phosphate isomerase/epimerase